MKAARIHKFGPPEVVVIEGLSRPNPGAGELLVEVRAAGVAPWDAIIREGKSKVSLPPALTLGSDLSEIVEEVGPGVTEFRIGDGAYGVTKAQFCGAHDRSRFSRNRLTRKRSEVRVLPACHFIAGPARTHGLPMSQAAQRWT